MFTHFDFKMVLWICMTVGAAWGGYNLFETRRRLGLTLRAIQWIIGAVFGAILGMGAAFALAFALGITLWAMSFFN